ncbi:integrase, catalytic region, zinc finger, CCHC-type containing protein [Tanacetum coccineum]
MLTPPRKKQVTFEDQIATSSSTTHKHVEPMHTQKSNVPVPPSTGVNSCTDASGSQPRSILKKHRIPPAKSDSLKKVEDHPRTIRSSLKTMNRVDSSISSKRTVVQIVLWYLDSGCSKHMTGDRSRLMNFVKKFIGTVRFGNDHFGAIMGYGDYVVEVAFRKHSCYVRDTDGVELLKGSRGSNLYTISVEDMMKSSPICLLSKASKHKSWLWHRRLNHLNFGTINDLARKDLQKAYHKTHGRKIAIGQRFSPTKSSAVHEKPNTPRSCLRWIPTGRIFKLAGLRWIPTGKMFTDSTTKVDSKHPNGSNDDITNPYECNQTLNVSAETRGSRNSNVMKMSNVVSSHQFRPCSSSIVDIRSHHPGPTPNLLTPGPISSGLVPNHAPAIPYVPPTNKELEMLFQPMFDEYFHPLGVHQDPIPNVVQDQVIPTGPSVSISIDLDAPSGSHISSPLDNHSSLVHHGVASEEYAKVNPFSITLKLHHLGKSPYLNPTNPLYLMNISRNGPIPILLITLLGIPFYR